MAFNSQRYTVAPRFTVSAAKTWATTDVNIVTDTINFPAHGFKTGDNIGMETTGAVPTGLAINTAYYVIPVDANTLGFATSRANAAAGTKIDLTAVGSGTGSLYLHGMGDTLTGVMIPAGHFIVNARYLTITAAAAQTTAGTLAMTVESAGDILAAAAVSTNVFTDSDAMIVGIPLINTVSTYVQTTADREVTFTTAVKNWDAGDIILFLEVVAAPVD